MAEHNAGAVSERGRIVKIMISQAFLALKTSYTGVANLRTLGKF